MGFNLMSVNSLSTRKRACMFMPALLCGLSSAHADLAGATVSAAGYCCTAVDPADLFTNVATGTVAVDFPEGTFFQTASFGNLFLVPVTINVESKQITLQWSGSGLFASGSFNGFHFEFSGASIPAITDVTVDSASTLKPTGVSFTSDSVDVSVAGELYGFGAQKAVLDISTSSAPATPESATWAMMLLGFVGLGLAGLQGARPRSAQ